MGDAWLDGFGRVPGNGSGTWASDNEDAPKIVLHSTEGGTADGAFSAYRKNNSWPHLTVDPHRRLRYQHVPLTIPARALRNTSTPGQTNREARVFQIEIVGFARAMGDMTNSDADWLGQYVLRPLADATGTPLVTSVKFYGEGAGWTLAVENARQRLTPAQWDTYTGVLAHQHVPENSHWDVGAFRIDRVLNAARGDRELFIPHPREDDDMTPEQAKQLTEARDHAAQANLRADDCLQRLERVEQAIGTQDPKGAYLPRLVSWAGRVEALLRVKV